jgi:hypothetical protein
VKANYKLESSNNVVKLVLSAALKSKKFLCFGADNPILFISKLKDMNGLFDSPDKKSNKALPKRAESYIENGWERLHKTECVWSTNTPQWKPI